MTTLFVIRHGRATALEAEYDKLHQQGERQARLLGEHLLAKRQRFDSVYVGPLRRQVETLRLMREAAGVVGAAWPESVTLEGLAEGPFEALMKEHIRPRLSSDAGLREIAQQVRGANDSGGRDGALSQLFDYMVGLWRRGEVAAEGLETSDAFFARVDGALAQIVAREGEGRAVAVITSNGVVGHLLERAGLPFASGTKRHRLYNSSVSLLELRGSSVAVQAHNLVEHIDDPQLLTVL